MIPVLLAHGIAALLAPWLVARLGTRAFPLLAIVPAGAVVWAATQTARVTDGGTTEVVHQWVPSLGMELAFRLDPLSLLMTFVAAGVGALVLAYCGRYFSRDEQGLGRFAAVLVAFAGAMLGLVLSDDLLVLFVFWELTTVLSFLLVGHNSDRLGSRRAAMDALIVTTFGGLAMLVGFIILGEAAGTYRISEIVANPPGGTTVSVGVALVLVGALSKSALVPFHFWLPGAMAAPTPVSAYLHAAAMVKAGVFLVARLAPGFAETAPWKPTILVLGLLTMLLGASRALRQHDLKLLLAYGTVSQLGLLTVLVGQGSRDVLLAGLGLLLAHALYKSALFLTVGIIDHDTGTRDLRVLSGLGRTRKRLAVIAGLAAASMAGVPLFAGFAAKETALDALLHGDAVDLVTLVAIVLGVALTAAYAWRFWWGAFATKDGVPDRRCDHADPHIELAPGLLAVGGLVLGIGFSALDALLARHADTAPSTLEKPLHLAGWHGVGVPLGLSLLALALGAVVVLVQRRLAGRPVPAEGTRRMLDARDSYVVLVRATERLSVAAARATQSGSLPVYLMTILFVFAAATATTLITGAPWNVELRVWDEPAQGAIGLLIVAATILTLRSRRRLKAVVLSGVVGYGVATLFALQGAPDLALTQFLVETVTLVVVVLVLRRLPSHFTGTVSSKRRRRVHLLTGVTVGTLMAVLTVVAAGAREAAPVSELFAAASKLAGGENIVNVTLVDLRAWDTMGEIAVLVVAATGVTSLLFLRRRTRAMPRLSDPSADSPVWAMAPADAGAGPPRARPGAGSRTDPSVAAVASSAGLLNVVQHSAGGAGTARRAEQWLVAENTLAPERRSILLEVVVRLIFHTVLVLSVYLLWAGHDVPGGGFAGGLVAGLAFTIRYLAGGRYELGEAAPVGAGLVIGLGLVIAVGTGLGGAIVGDAVLQGGSWKPDVPLLGTLKLYSSTLFDIGVYLVVVGVVLDVLRSFGSEIDRQVDEETHGRRPTVQPAPTEESAS
ncbi:Na+/H+ antiporter subunit A [Patulibacter sp.]|uniref:Na+/H+ antiporter subunit A n=1 Tax=Patulibacter sp. TaxID=1912859 RepID=UPI0027196C0B|nr:Na+/H+ antiporter subunit A [Patulibacter sp.]MDO9410306.1 Na+/H+ antiporter subunit A [Patulibacter sp.]